MVVTKNRNFGVGDASLHDTFIVLIKMTVGSEEVLLETEINHIPTTLLD